MSQSHRDVGRTHIKAAEQNLRLLHPDNRLSDLATINTTEAQVAVAIAQVQATIGIGLVLQDIAESLADIAVSQRGGRPHGCA